MAKTAAFRKGLLGMRRILSCAASCMNSAGTNLLIRFLGAITGSSALGISNQFK